MGYAKYLNNKKRDRSNDFAGLISLDHVRETEIKPGDELFENAMWNDKAGICTNIARVIEILDEIFDIDATNPSLSNYTSNWFISQYKEALSNSGDGSGGLYPNGFEDQDINQDADLLQPVTTQRKMDEEATRTYVEDLIDSVLDDKSSTIVARSVYQYYFALRVLTGGEATQYGEFDQGELIGPSDPGDRTVDALGDFDPEDPYDPDAPEEGPPHVYTEVEEENPDYDPEDPESSQYITVTKWIPMEEGTDYEIVSYERFAWRNGGQELQDIKGSLSDYIDFLQSKIDQWDVAVNDFDVTGLEDMASLDEERSFFQAGKETAQGIIDYFNSHISELESEFERIDAVLRGDDVDYYDRINELPEQEGDSGDDEQLFDLFEGLYDIGDGPELLEEIGTTFDSYDVHVRDLFDQGFANEDDNTLNDWKRQLLIIRLEKPTGTYVRVLSSFNAMANERDSIKKHTRGLTDKNVPDNEMIVTPGVITAYADPKFNIDDELVRKKNAVVGTGGGHATKLHVYRAEGPTIADYMTDPSEVEIQWEEIHSTSAKRLTDNDNSLDLKFKEEIDESEKGKLFWYRYRLEDDPNDSPLSSDGRGGELPSLYPSGNKTLSMMSPKWTKEPGEVTGTVENHRSLSNMDDKGTVIIIDDVEEDVTSDYQLRARGYIFIEGKSGVFMITKAADDKIVVYPEVDANEGEEVSLAIPAGLMMSWTS